MQEVLGEQKRIKEESATTTRTILIRAVVGMLSDIIIILLFSELH